MNSGSKVAFVQYFLWQLGYLSGSEKTAVDGKFGPKTDAGVRKFQKDEKIKVDGKVGPETFNKMIEAFWD